MSLGPTRKGPSLGGSAQFFAFLLTAALAHGEASDDLLNAGKKAFADGFYDVAAGTFQRVVSDYPQATAAV